MTESLITPHGGRLQNLIVSNRRSKELVNASIDHHSWTLTDRQLCDLDMLLSGAYSPLDGFLGKDDYKSVLETMRLKDGILWPIPVTLDVTEDFANSVSHGEKIMLRDKEGFAIAVLTLEEKWKPDLLAEARYVFNTTDILHPGVIYRLFLYQTCLVPDPHLILYLNCE